ncbi:hypothetical protein GOV07_00065 [Candidatus Woesearchaeota archaeon]|nr:hypothetical protein [Candidatus Woesearchaeota archaeon]
MDEYEALDEIGPGMEIIDRIPAFLGGITPYLMTEDLYFGCVTAFVAIGARAFQWGIENTDHIDWLNEFGFSRIASPRILRERQINQTLRKLY